MNNIYNHLWIPFNEEKKAINKKSSNNKKDKKFSDNKENKKDDDEPAWYNPSHLIGKATGYIAKRFDQGFTKGYGGVADNRLAGYNPHKAKEDKDDEPAWYNPIYAIGKGLGKMRKDSDKGFSKAYGGTMHINDPFNISQNRFGYDPNPKSVKEEFNLDFNGCLYNCGGRKNKYQNSLFSNNINGIWNDDDADKLNPRSSLFRGPGDNWSRGVNEPAIRAAGITNARPDNMTLYNGVNKISEEYEEPFSFKNYRR